MSLLMTANAEILERTRNAKATVTNAPKFGWEVHASYSENDLGDASLLVQLRRVDSMDRLSALWVGVPNQPLAFDGAWHRLNGQTRKLNYTQFTQIMKGTTPAPQADPDAKVSWAAIENLLHLATPLRVQPTGRQCSGKAPVNLPGMPFLPCSNQVIPGDSLCAGPCQPLLADLTKDTK